MADALLISQHMPHTWRMRYACAWPGGTTLQFLTRLLRSGGSECHFWQYIAYRSSTGSYYTQPCHSLPGTQPGVGQHYVAAAITWVEGREVLWNTVCCCRSEAHPGCACTLEAYCCPVIHQQQQQRYPGVVVVAACLRQAPQRVGVPRPLGYQRTSTRGGTTSGRPVCRSGR